MLNRIGFTGPFADSNLGDYGMLVNNLLDMTDKVEYAELFTYDDAFVSRIATDYLSSLDVSICTVQTGEELEWRAREGERLTPIEILQGVTNYSTIEERIAVLDVLVVNGGGFLNELWCQPHRVSKMLKILAPILIADDLGIRIVFTGNSYGPFGPRSEFLANVLASLRHAMFYARDRVGSTAELRRLGISDELIHFAPDDLFVMNKGVRVSEAPLELPDSYIAFETYQPLDVLKAHRDELERFTANMRERGLQVVLLPMYAGRGGQEQATWLADEFGWTETEMASGYVALEHARQVVRGAQLIVCERYHGLVLALANAVPAVHVIRSVMGDKWYYYRKSLGIIDTALCGASYRQQSFMATSLFQAMDKVGDRLEEIQHVQQEWFAQTLSTNIERSLSSRRRMLDRITFGG